VKIAVLLFKNPPETSDIGQKMHFINLIFLFLPQSKHNSEA